MDTNENAQYLYLLVAFIITGTIIFSFILSAIMQQRRYLRLSQAKVNAEINALEVDRKRIASDLHDDLGPVLSSVKNILESIPDLPEDSKRMQERAVNYLDGSIVKMRQIAKSLMPSALLRKGLLFAVQEFIDYMQHPQTEIVFSYTDPGFIPEEDRIQIFRILQEIIHNTLKHANGTLLTIDLEQSETALIIKTTDNGKGFDLPSIRQQHYATTDGFGLQGIETRAGLLKATLQIDSKPMKGTTYYLHVPIKTLHYE